jgi:hypothetical protein
MSNSSQLLSLGERVVNGVSLMRGHSSVLAHLIPARVQLTPHPARVPMKCIGIAVHPLPKGEG